jgi:RimJ/RimL family protein N-acetyltransferase
MLELRTPRLLLRQWRAEDRAPLAAMSADPEVMRYLRSPASPDDLDAWMARIAAHHARAGYGFWAVEMPGVAPFIGAVGLLDVTMDVPFAPTVEIGWRLARPYWGQGLATEAASACLDHAFRVLGLPEVVAFAVPPNAASQAVMRRLGMTRDEAEDFQHPRLPQGDPLRLHRLYRIRREAWAAR